MAGTGGTMTSLLDHAYQGLEEKVQEIKDNFLAIVQHVRDWKYVLGPALIFIRNALEKIWEWILKMEALVTVAIRHHFPVVSLIIQGFNWLDHVQAPVSGLPHSKSAGIANWEGAASNVYNERVAAQNEAIGAVGAKAGEISKWLIDIAKYNVEYMTKLSGMVTELVGKIVSATIEAATVVEIPFAIDAMADAVGQLATAALDNLIGIAERFVEALSKVRDLKSMMNDPKLPGGQWPQAVTG